MVIQNQETLSPLDPLNQTRRHKDLNLNRSSQVLWCSRPSNQEETTSSNRRIRRTSRQVASSSDNPLRDNDLQALSLSQNRSLGGVLEALQA